MKLFAQIQKVDEAKRLVFGRAAEEVVDKSDEIMDYAGSKPHFVKWSEEVAKDTDGKSLGNVRAMHGKVAAGKLTQIDFNDAAKAIDVCAKVVDDAEWKKVLEGVYTGFSIGGAYVGESKVEKVDGRDVKRYVARPNEISLVDRPCMPTAKFFEVQKADGSLAKVDFQPAAADDKTPNPDEVTVDGSAEEVAALGKLMNEHGLSLADLIAKGVPALVELKKAEATPKPADSKPAADKPIEKVEPAVLRKGLYDAEQFAKVLSLLDSLQKNAAYEAYMEGDDSPLPARIGAAIALVGEVFKSFLDECLAERKAGTEMASPALIALAEQAGLLTKADGSRFAKIDADPLVALVKIGARNSASDLARIGKIHDCAVELGATCGAHKAAPAAASDEAALQKLVSDAVTPLQKLLDDQAALIKKLSDQPAPTRVALRAVAKHDDVDNTAPLAKNEPPAPIKDDLGDDHHAAGLIKSLHQRGGVPLAMPHALTK